MAGGNYKTTLRKETNYLRGLSYLDKELRSNWINRNAATLRRAKNKLGKDEYKAFAEGLYKIQLWKGLEQDNIAKGVYRGHTPTMSDIDNYFAEKIKPIDDTLKYYPDTDANGVYVGSKKNTGWSPEIWQMYNNLKDDASREKFKSSVDTENKVWDKAAILDRSDKDIGISTWGGYNISEAYERAKEYAHPEKVDRNSIGTEWYDEANKANTEKAQAIYSQSLSKYRSTKQYKALFNTLNKEVQDRWKNEGTKADEKHKNEFLDLVKENSILSAAAGYNSKNNKFNKKQFDQYMSLMQEEPQFRINYIAHEKLLSKQLELGAITEDDYKQSLIDIAANALKDHESFWKRSGNLIKATVNTGMTYSLHKLAPIINMGQLAANHTDGKVFRDVQGNIYKDSDVLSKALFDKKKPDEATLFTTEDGSTLNYNENKSKIFNVDGVSYIYQGDDKKFYPTTQEDIEQLSGGMKNPHIKRVFPVKVKNTEISDHDLSRLGIYDNGEDIGGVFNEKYLQMADKYNDWVWNRENLDYFNQNGYSNYVNIQRPGDESTDFVGECLKMSGFMAADLISALIPYGIGKLGAATKVVNLTQAGMGILGGIGIADSYAQGVFEENLMNNQQAINDLINDDAQKAAENWANSNEGKSTINDTYKQTIFEIENKYNRTLSETEKKELQSTVRNNVVSRKALQYYNDNVQSSKYLDLQEKAVSDAGTSAVFDFLGEGLKYSLVNVAGYRKWMFKSNAAEEAARASEKSLFGKTFSRVGEATVADVEAGRANKVGQIILKDAWSNKSILGKARLVGEKLGTQAWGGAWTNWTDEWQSWGAKEMNNAVFENRINGNDDGAYLLGTAIAANVRGMQQSVLLDTSIDAALIGGVGSMMGIGLNVIGIVDGIAHPKAWQQKTFGQKVASIFSNGTLNEILQIKANEAQAEAMVAQYDKLINSIGPSAEEIMKLMQSAAQLGKSESAIDNTDTSVLHFFNILSAIKSFSETNPGLMELDYAANLRALKEQAEKLSDPSKLTEEEKKEYIEQIKVYNPGVTDADAVEHFDTMARRAKLMTDAIESWESLHNSKDFKRLSIEDQQDAEERAQLDLLQKYTLDNIREREEEINGHSTIETIDGIDKVYIDENGAEVHESVKVGRYDPVSTWGSETGLKKVKQAFEITKARYENFKANMEKALSKLDFEKKAAELKEKLEKTTSPTEKEKIEKQLSTLTRDYLYYQGQIEYADSRLKANEDRYNELKLQFDNAKKEDFKVLSAEEILRLDPEARARMLYEGNLNNYTEAQQKQINRTNKILEDKGLSFQDIKDQAVAVSKYQQRDEILYNLSKDNPLSLSFETRINNMLETAKDIASVEAVNTVTKDLESIDSIDGLTNEDKVELKKAALRRLSASSLKYLKDHLDKSNSAIPLIDELIPVAEAGSQIMQLIWDDRFGLGKDYSKEEKDNIQQLTARALMQSSTIEEFMNILADYAVKNNSPTINSLLDKYSKVYEQSTSTIVESAKQKAQRMAEERARREKEAQAALEAKKKQEAEKKAKKEKEAEEKKRKESTESADKPNSPEEGKIDREKETEEKGKEEKKEGEKKKEETPAPKKTDEELKKEAKDKIQESQKLVQPVEERDTHADFYLINGKKYTRVHGAMGDTWIGPNSQDKEARSARALKDGAIIDSIVRDFFNGHELTKPEHFTDEAFEALKTSLEAIKAKMQESGEEFLANNIVLYHEFPNGVRIAGEADIVSIKVVDGKIQYNIYDLKTSSGGKSGKVFTESAYWKTSGEADRYTIIGIEEQYTNQVSLYKLLFERMFGVQVSKLALLPYKISYDADSNVTGIEKQSGIPLNYSSDVEKIVAYQPAIDEAIIQIANTYKGLFTKEQLATLKGIIINGIIKGESFAADLVSFLQNQGLTEKFAEIGNKEINPIIKHLKEEIAKIDVSEILKEETKVSETPSKEGEVPAPQDIATKEPSKNEYSPDKDYYEAPSGDDSFNTMGNDSNSMEVEQPTQVKEEDLDVDSTGEEAEVIKGNPMNPYVYEDKTPDVSEDSKQDVQRGILVEKEARENLQAYKDWMASRSIDLQGLIDDKLSDILSIGTEDSPVKIQFMRVNPNMTAKGNDKIKGHYLLVVEDSPALRKVYTQKDVEKYGDFVEANGKKYLIVGTAGFANDAQGKAYRRVLTTGKDSVQVKSNEYFKEHENEEFYVDQDKYTHVAKVHSGFIIKQMVGDSKPQIRPVSELLEDAKRNPLGLTWDDLVFGYQLMNEFRTVPGRPYPGPINTAANLGNVFMYIKGVNGQYTPVMLMPTRYSEIKAGSELQRAIETALRQLASTNHEERYKGLLEMFNLVVLGQKESTKDNPKGLNILIGTKDKHVLTFMKDNTIMWSADLTKVSFQEILDHFTNVFNPRISVTYTDLISEQRLKRLDAAGALRTDVARLGKASGDFSVYSVDSNGKPIITDKVIHVEGNESGSRGSVQKIRIGEQYYSVQGDSYIDETGNIVTDQGLLYDIEVNEVILNSSNVEITIGEYVYNVLENDVIVRRINGSHRDAFFIDDSSEINRVHEEMRKIKEENERNLREEAAEVALEETKPTEEAAPVETPTEPSNPKDAVTDLLKEETTQEEKDNKHPAPIVPVTETADINKTERKSLIDSSRSENNGNFASETSALDILTDWHYTDKALDVISERFPETDDMNLNQIVDYLKEKGKQVEGIKDVQTWIDTLKC